MNTSKDLKLHRTNTNQWLGFAAQFTVFLTLNFAALALGSYLMDFGPSTQWYDQLKKAPWSPPGWAFGVAWTTIMLLFAIYMTVLWRRTSNSNHKKVLVLFSIQWLFNVSWNYVFFNLKLIHGGLMNLIILLAILLILFTSNLRVMKLNSIFMLPYILWMFVALSLNTYIVFFN